MLHWYRLFTALTFTVAVPAASLTQTCSAPLFPGPATAIDSACGVAGNGGAETNQNTAKNNFCAPAPSIPITFAGMAALQAKVQADKTINFGNPKNHPLTKKAGPATNRAHLVALGEGNLVTLEGFVLIARQEGAESVNCGSSVPNAPVSYDIHIALVDALTTTNECSAAIAEMVPHHRPASWTHANVASVAGKHLPVRVTGQLMFDSSHTPCVSGAAVPGDPKRASLWEIHPIYQFEVCPSGDCSAGTGWQNLEDWVKSPTTPAPAQH